MKDRIKTLSVLIIFLIFFVVSASAQLKSETFEDGDHTDDGWNVVQGNAWNLQSSGGGVLVGNYSAGRYTNNAVSSNTIIASNNFSLGDPGTKIYSVEFYYKEKISQYSGGLFLENKAGDPVLGLYTNNPQWTVLTSYDNATSFYGGDGYEELHRVKAYFDWNAETVDVYWENLDTGTEVNDTFNLENVDPIYRATVSTDYPYWDRTSDQIFQTSVDNITIRETPLNEPPSIDSKNLIPDPPVINDYISYNASVSDVNGNYNYTNLTVTYGQNTIIQDSQNFSSTPEWNNITQIKTANKWLNATFEAVDTDGATTTEEINRYIGDTRASIQINEPDNITYNSRNRNYQIDLNNDTDNDLFEEFEIKIYNNSDLIRTVVLQEPSDQATGSYTVENYGKQNLTIESTEINNKGNTVGTTQTKTVYYTVENQAPSTSNAGINPASPIYGDSLDTFIDATDEDGIKNVTVTVEKGGSTVVSNSSMSNTQGDTYRVDNVVTVDQEEVYYNFTYYAYDNFGKLSKDSFTHYQNNDPPTVQNIYTDPVIGNWYANASIDVYADINDTNDVTGAKVWVEYNNSYIVSGQDMVESGNWVLNDAFTVDNTGEYNITVQAEDTYTATNSSIQGSLILDYPEVYSLNVTGTYEDTEERNWIYTIAIVVVFLYIVTIIMKNL